MSNPDETEESTHQADEANGEPNATDENRTGEQQVAANRESDPPA